MKLIRSLLVAALALGAALDAAAAAGGGPLSIVRHGPQGAAQGQVQVVAEFDRPLVPLATLDDASRERILSHLRIDPPVEGSFRLLGTAAVVFEPLESLPLSSRFTVTVAGGLTALDGSSLENSFSWSFTTPEISIWLSPGDGADHVVLEPDITVGANMALDLRSLREKASLVAGIDGIPLPLDIAEDEENPRPDEDIGVHREGYRYHLRLPSPLERDTAYRLVVSPGVAPRRGNLASRRSFESRFRTYPPFRLLGSGFCGGCGPRLQTRPYIDFSNSPDWEDFGAKATLDPAPRQWPFREWGCDGRSYAVTVDDGLLDPGRTYRASLPAGLRDVFGQALENPGDVSFVTGALTPALYGPSGYQVISPKLPPQFAVKTAGIPTVSYRIIPLTPRDILVREALSDYDMTRRLLERIPGGTAERALVPGADGLGRADFDLRELLGGEGFGAVAYEFLSPKVACSDRPQRLDGVLLRTDLGIYSQFLPTGARIKVNRLTDGSPVAGVSVALYRSDELPRLEEVWDRITGTRVREPGGPCATGVTAEDGILRLGVEEMRSCGRRTIGQKVLNELLPAEADPDDVLYDQERFGFAEPPELTVVAASGEDWTFLQTRDYGVPSIWQFGVMSAWEGERPVPRGTIFSDRNIYRPGETVTMKGVSRYLLYGRMHRGAGSQYEVTVTDPRGREETLTKVRVSEFGTFSFEVPTKPGQPLGHYRVSAKGAHGDLRFWGGFRLAEYRAPEFVVSLAADRAVAVAGEPVTFSWDGRYYFGAPMKGSPSRLDIVREDSWWRPEGWEGYAFGIPWHLQDRQSEISGQVSSEKIPLDDEGKASKGLTVAVADLPRPMLYRVFAEVEDVTGQTASAERSVVLLPDRRLAALRLDRWIVRKGDEVRASVTVVDPGGAPVAGTAVNVKLLRREWHSIQREAHDGRVVTEHEQVVTEVESRGLTTAARPLEVALTPPSAGSYMVRVELADAPGGGTAAATALWAAGEEYVPWEGSGEDRLEIIFDKKEYAVGDEAVALIRSPFRRADIYLTLCRERIFSEEVVPFEGSAFTWRFTVTEEMLPNAFLGAFLVNRGEPLLETAEETGRHMEKIGFAPFRVSKKSRRLSVSPIPQHEKYRPGEEVEVKVKVKDHVDKGWRSELTVMVVDESVLALTDYRPPDLVDIVYADRGLSARVNDNRPFLISRAELLQKGQGYGGGAEDSPRVRKKFLRLAHFEPSLVTDGEGEASFRFTLPDNLTTFRIMVVAVGDEDRFGFGDETITVTQPFLARPSFPRFTRVGDTFFAGVALSNLGESPGTAEVSAEIVSGGDVLRFAGSDPSSASARGVALAGGEARPLLFPLVSLRPGRAVLRFTSSFSGAGGAAESDALEVGHEVRDIAATETVVAVGETLDRAVQGIRVDGSARDDTGGLRVSLSSSALAGLGESASYLVQYPYGCLEQTVSRLLALEELRRLAGKYGFTLDSAKPADQVIEANMRKVYAMQNWDGGFRFWPTSEESTCWISPYVAALFARRAQFGEEVDRDAAEGLKRYLHNVLRNPCTPLYSWQSKAEYRIRVLEGLSLLGERDQNWFEEFFSRRRELSYGAQISLARLLQRTPGWEGSARTMLAEILNGLFVTARSAHFEEPRQLPPSWVFLSSPVITTAEGLTLLLAMDPGHELVAKMARYLLDARVNGRWRNTYENARALDALVEVSLKREQEPPDFHAEVRLAEKVVLEEAFAGHDTALREAEVAAAGLPRGESEISVAREGTGRLYYTLAYSYRLRGPRRARSEGFLVKRTVRDWESGEEVVVFDGEPPPRAALAEGRVYQVELEFKAPQTGYHFVLDDSLPAGLEPIDTSLKTTSGRYGSGEGTEDTRGGDYAYGYWWNPFNHRELRDDGAGLFADALRPGVYRFRYLARASTAGTFLWPGARASLMYEPEQFGTCAEGEVEVTGRSTE